MSIVRAAIVQDFPVVFNLEATLDKVRQLVREAARLDAGLVVFPEAFVSGYPKGLDFGARIGMRLPAGREDFRRYFQSAIEIPGPASVAIGAAARESGVYLVIGVIEKEIGTLYCTVCFFSPDGGLLGKHRKLMPTAMERLVWGFGDGSTMPVLDTPIGRIGAVICWENYMPLLRMYMYSKGVQIYCAPTADDRDTWLASMQHIALEGRCFVLSACQYLRRGDCPEKFDAIQGNDPETVLMRGGSCIISPLGEVLVAPNFNGPAILRADLELDRIPEGKYDLDTPGHYARPDVFRLQVNLRSQRAVTAWGNEESDPFVAPGLEGRGISDIPSDD